MGAWIEIKERILKHMGKIVVPLVGAWIEITYMIGGLIWLKSRAPRGRVD